MRWRSSPRFYKHFLNMIVLCSVLGLSCRENRGAYVIVFVLFCNVHVISQRCPGNRTREDLLLPPSWPCYWKGGKIPFVYNFYTLSIRRLMSIIRKGHDYIEKRSCLTFEEYDPIQLAKRENFTYIYYTYSGVLENCCLPFYSNPVGRRMVLITPICSLPGEVAHATLHAMGLDHSKSGFHLENVKPIFFQTTCPDIKEKYRLLTNNAVADPTKSVQARLGRDWSPEFHSK